MPIAPFHPMLIYYAYFFAVSQGSGFFLEDCHIVIMSSSSYKVLDYQKPTDVCLSTMDGTPDPTVNAYMAVLIEKCSKAEHWKNSAAVILVDGMIWLKGRSNC